MSNPKSNSERIAQILGARAELQSEDFRLRQELAAAESEEQRIMADGRVSDEEIDRLQKIQLKKALVPVRLQQIAAKMAAVDSDCDTILHEARAAGQHVALEKRQEFIEKISGFLMTFADPSNRKAKRRCDEMADHIVRQSNLQKFRDYDRLSGSLFSAPSDSGIEVELRDVEATIAAIQGL